MKRTMIVLIMLWWMTPQNVRSEDDVPIPPEELKAKLTALSAELPPKTVKALLEFKKNLKPFAANFPLIETTLSDTNSLKKVHIFKQTLNRLGTHLDAIRFKTPDAAMMTLQWICAAPGEARFGWDIMAVQNPKVNGFYPFSGDFIRKKITDVPWPDNYKVLSQGTFPWMEGNTEYLIYFYIPSDKPIDFYIGITVFPNLIGFKAPPPGEDIDAYFLRFVGLRFAPEKK